MGEGGQCDKRKGSQRTLILLLCQSFLALDLTFVQVSDLANPRLGRIKVVLDTINV